jgi:hypothetical protein
VGMLAFDTWVEVVGVNLDAFRLFKRHYTFNPYRDGRRERKDNPNRHRFVGPGPRMVLMTPRHDALFVWRKERYRLDNQAGVHCAVFRNESGGLSSVLILAAEEMAWERWPGERLFTFVNPRKVRSTNPGFCFLKAGWRRCGLTKKRKLLILEKQPQLTGASS